MGYFSFGTAKLLLPCSAAMASKRPRGWSRTSEAGLCLPDLGMPFQEVQQQEFALQEAHAHGGQTPRAMTGHSAIRLHTGARNAEIA